MVRCKLSDFGANTDIFNKSLWGNGFCVDENKNKNYSMKNPTTNGAINFTHFTIFLFPCENSTENNFQCAPQETIDELLATFYIHIDFMDNYMDANDFENPVKRIRVTKDFPAGLNQHVEINLLFNDLKFINDDGFIFEEISETKHLRLFQEQFFSETNLGIEYQFPNELAFINFAYNGQGIHSLVERKYQKFPEIIAAIGGILKILNLFIFYVNLPISSFYKNIETINKFFEFPEEEKKLPQHLAQDSSIASKTIFDIREAQSRNYNNFVNYQSENNNDKLKVVEGKTKKRIGIPTPKIVLKLSFTETLLLFFRMARRKGKSGSHKINLYERGEKEINNYFDILTVIKRFNDVENLKKIKLNDYQLYFFDMLNPKLSETAKKRNQVNENEWQDKFTLLQNDNSRCSKRIIDMWIK